MLDKRLQEKLLNQHSDGLTLQISEESVSDLIQFIKENPQVITPIELEHLGQTPLQRIVDEAIAENVYQSALETEGASTQAHSIHSRQKITRPRDVLNAVGIATNIEEEIYQEITTSVSTEVVESVESQGNAAKAISFETFQQLFRDNTNTLVATSEVVRLWYRLFSIVVTMYDFEGQDAEKAFLESNAWITIPSGAHDDRYSMHPLLKGITQDAAKMIILHARQFSFGLDCTHLPNGFQIIKGEDEANTEQWVLDYKPAKNPSANPFAIVPVQAKTCDSISHTQFLNLIQNTSPGVQRELLQAHNGLLEAEHYDRNDLLQFRNQLPFLMQLKEEALENLFRLAFSQEKRCLDGDKLSYLIESKQKYDFSVHKIVTSNEPTLILREDIPLSQAVCNFFNTTPHIIPFEAHAIQKVLETDLKQHLADLNAYYQFSPTQLNNLFRLYAAKGQPSLSNVLEILLHFQKTYPDLANQLMANVPDLGDVLNHSMYTETMNRLAAMSSAERAWWHALSTQHMQAVPQDNILTLLKSFHEFSLEIRKLGLAFYEPVGFSQIRSLPTALARMLRILKHCNAVDIPAQWDVITQLPLHSGGAIRAIEDRQAQHRPCRFLTPEMQFSNRRYCFARDSEAQSEPAPFKGYLDISGISDPELAANALYDSCHPYANRVRTQSETEVLSKKTFYRYIAGQKQAASLQFYRDALDYLEKHPLWDTAETSNGRARSLLYKILAGATTGLDKRIQTPEQHEKAFTEWTDFVNHYEKLEKLPLYARPFKTFIQHLLISSIANLKFIPRFSELKALIKAQDTILQSLQVNLQLLQHPFKKLGDLLYSILNHAALNELKKADQVIAYFNSMKFLKAFDRTTVHAHFKTLSDIGKTLSILSRNKGLIQARVQPPRRPGEYRQPEHPVFNETNEPIEPMLLSILSVVSTFQITAGNMGALIDFEKSNAPGHADLSTTPAFPVEYFNQPQVLYALSLFSQIEHNENLSIESLKAFLNELPHHELDYPAIHACLKHHFKDHFEQTFWDTLSGDDIDKELFDLIHQTVQSPETRDACIQFFARFPKHTHAKNLETLFALSKSLDEQSQDTFMHYIVNADLFDIHDVATLETLLQSLSESNMPQHWVFAFNHLSKIKQSHPLSYEEQLQDILSVWLKDIVPVLDEDKTTKPHPNLPRLQALMLRALSQSSLKDALNNYIIEDNCDALGTVCRRYKELVVGHQQASSILLEVLQFMVEENCFRYRALETLCDLFEESDDLTCLALGTLLCNQSSAFLTQFIETLDASDILKNPALKNQFTAILSIHASRNADIDLQTIKFLFEAEPLEAIAPFYATPPYPDLSLVGDWLASGQSLEAQYRAFEHHPCDREQANRFDRSKAQIQRDAMSGVHVSDEDLDALEAAVKTAKATINVETLKQALENAAMENDVAKMVAFSAEIMHRSMGSQHDSYEINTTQYLAAFTLLKQEPHVCGEIASGEGKTRVFMVLAACQWAQNKKVDFVTRNLSLASREFMTYQSFFKALGADTTLIHSQSTHHELSKEGIRFSDVASLSLARNQCRSQGLTYQQPGDKLALLLDEADPIYYDSLSIKYNFARVLFKQCGGVSWVYPMLIDFFSSEQHQTLFYEDVKGCNDTFRNFVRARVDTKTWQAFNLVSDKQIERWHSAAQKAMKLRYPNDFMIQPDEPLYIPGQGNQKFSRALVVKKETKRTDAHSSFSGGVQQCLHALLNSQMQQAPNASELSKALQTCEAPFIIKPESHIIVSTDSKNFMDDYQEETMIALSGTMGNPRERKEASTIYSAAEQSMVPIIDFPRHHPLNRLDLPLKLTANAGNQFKAILAEIKRAQDLNQPVLLIAEHDEESQKLYQALKKEFSKASLTRIHANTSTRAEQHHILQRAGQPGQITVSTDRLGRGVDVPVHKGAEQHGLHVVTTYLAPVRDESQTKNRTSRFGKKGSTRKILDKQRLLTQTGRPSLPGEFFTHRPEPIQKMQDSLDRVKQFKRIVSFAVSDMNQQLQQLFFANCEKTAENTICEETLSKWSDFQDEQSLLWEDYSRHIDQIIARDTFQDDEIVRQMNQYGDDVRALWQDYFDNLINLDEIKHPEPDCRLLNEVKSMPPVKSSFKNAFFKSYDSAHDGFAARYDHWFAETRAVFHGERALFANTRAWCRGEGILFANLRAWLRGEMSFFEYLFPVKTEQCQDHLEQHVEAPALAEAQPCSPTASPDEASETDPSGFESFSLAASSS